MKEYEKNRELEALVAQAQQGDRQSLDRLVQRVQPRLREYISARTLDKQLVSDLLQETMMQIVKSLPRLKDAGRFWAWAYRIATNISINHYRKMKRRRAVRFSTLEDCQLEEVLKDTSRPADRRMVMGELTDMVEESISRLKEKTRRILNMRWRENMPYSRISRQLGCSELSARLVCCRARQKILDHLRRQDMHRLDKSLQNALN
ncbi:MAG: sigma-70 family RNA polymerase sigma factor [Sedimentisphaerales bacterium]|nr:sigma-70 family RNA polymerase sigma factor [Sedimentisphaerales bacterium]